ncbi:hypothetical protein M422DRAFT_781394 [Sphaerobolus stellatus SS14]|uniref:C3H1-type domain-containing protein n=1 Tax=Sphaerobolus stellatus (strain SS14) TaxID=990650 RepID=A0A0C9U663_SPHS4|nr:hypothetical protein M422DRAFT_781394 [Sphaerobolus stellatus SS14]
MDDGKIWERLLEEQTNLFRKTTQKNADLEARVVELERELNVWKLAFSTTEQEKVLFQKQVNRLERNIGSLKDDNPLVLCLIDGDGNIFSSDLLAQGRAGGAQAAQLLTKGITDYLIENEDNASDSSCISGRAKIWVSVYCNKSGLQETITSRQLCTTEQFEAFIVGFNHASPLFSIIDVGHGKEAADTKIKECLRVFTRFPQTCKVFFGGGHDNGYATTLNALNNEGYLDKVILLRGYHEVAFELRALQLPYAEFEGVFMTRKLPYNPSRKPSAHSSGDSERRPAKISHGPQPSITKHKVKSHLAPIMLASGTKFDPPPCNFHYLAVCKSAGNCRYGHDYQLTPDDLTIMRVNAKKSPCGHANRSE